MLIAAMWDAAVQELHIGDVHTPFPFERHAHATLLVEELTHKRRSREGWPSFYSDAPFQAVSFETKAGRFRASVTPDGVDWEGEDDETGTKIARKRADLRYPHEATLLQSMLTYLDRHETKTHATVPLE
jgi:hypothetical protein